MNTTYRFHQLSRELNLQRFFFRFPSIAWIKISNQSTYRCQSPFLLSSTTILRPHRLHSHECGKDTLQIEHIARRESLYGHQLQMLLSNVAQSQCAFCFLPKPCLKYEKRWTILVHAHYLSLHVTCDGLVYGNKCRC